jgi:Protein of unknown function (DUF2970)
MNGRIDAAFDKPPMAGQALPAPSFAHSIKTVAWSFLGIRKRSEFENDLARVNPLHVILVAVTAVLIFVVGLIFVVNWVVAK